MEPLPRKYQDKGSIYRSMEPLPRKYQDTRFHIQVHNNYPGSTRIQGSIYRSMEPLPRKFQDIRFHIQVHGTPTPRKYQDTRFGSGSARSVSCNSYIVIKNNGVLRYFRAFRKLSQVQGKKFDEKFTKFQGEISRPLPTFRVLPR